MKTNSIPEKLWLIMILRHGDPPPDELRPVDQLVFFEALHELAGRLGNAALRKEAQDFAMRAIGSIAQGLGK